MKNKYAIITGATSGLGRAYAIRLAQEGWHLLITGRRTSMLEELKDELEMKYNTAVKICIVDFIRDDQFNRFLDAIRSYAHIDLLINNAGYGNRDGFFEEDFQSQANMLNVHVLATTKIVHEVVPIMLQDNRGAIINVASMSAFIPAPLNYFYCSSKAFMVSFTECLHMDLSHTNIVVQALCPGYIRTEFHSRMGLKIKKRSVRDKLLWMNPEEVVMSSLKSLRKNRVICIPGFFNKLAYGLMKMLPRSISYRVLKKYFPKYHHSECKTVWSCEYSKN